MHIPWLRSTRIVPRAFLLATLALAAAGCGAVAPAESSDGAAASDTATGAGGSTVSPPDDAGAPDASSPDVPLSCPAGFADCDGDRANGCEADLATPAHCGSCATACAEPAPLCAMSTPPACASGCSGATPKRCDATCVDTQTDVNHCGGCDMPCPVRPNAAPACANSACSWSCQPGFVDLDGDLAAARDAVSTGCECKRSGSVDRPDLAFTDDDCDGIDGAVVSAVFVSPRGADGNAGTMAAPKKTLAAAIAAAAGAIPRRRTGPTDGMVSTGNSVRLRAAWSVVRKKTRRPPCSVAESAAPGPPARREVQVRAKALISVPR